MDQRPAAALRIMATGRNALSSIMRSRQELLEFKQWKKGTKKDNYFKINNYEIFLNNNKAIAFLKRAPRPMGVSKGREKSSLIYFLLHKDAADGPRHLWRMRLFQEDEWKERSQEALLFLTWDGGSGNVLQPAVLLESPC